MISNREAARLRAGWDVERSAKMGLNVEAIS